MAIKEQDKVFYEVADNGDKVINLPVTRANNVEGLGRSASTAYVVGDIVYVDNNKKVALKCIIAGTTSNIELDISGKVVGESVEDGSVVWKVIERSNVLDEGGIVPIANGGTGATTAYQAMKNLGFGKDVVTAKQLDSLPINTIVGVMGGTHTDMNGHQLDFSKYYGVAFTFGNEETEKNQIIFSTGSLYVRTNDAGNYGETKRIPANYQYGHIGRSPTITVNVGTYVDAHVVFPFPYYSKPKIIVSLWSESSAYQNYGLLQYSIHSDSNTGFTIRTFLSGKASYASAPIYDWIAFEQ